jgi:hypothetical protein
MMVTRARLLARLEAIGRALATDCDGLALLGLGSCGQELDRLDDWSDLDFFAIVAPHAKQRFIADLWWLATEAPIVFAHRNTPDGWKILSTDGVFCEFAVFAPGELATIPFSPGRILWAREGFDTRCTVPLRIPDPVDVNWQVAEALGNLLVGLKRMHRGEVLAGWQSVVVHAGDQALRALKAASPGGDQAGDRWNPIRRLESDDPELAELALGFAQTPDATRAAARAILEALAARFALPGALVDDIGRHLDLP